MVRIFAALSLNDATFQLGVGRLARLGRRLKIFLTRFAVSLQRLEHKYVDKGSWLMPTVGH